MRVGAVTTAWVQELAQLPRNEPNRWRFSIDAVHCVHRILRSHRIEMNSQVIATPVARVSMIDFASFRSLIVEFRVHVGRYTRRKLD